MASHSIRNLTPFFDLQEFRNNTSCFFNVAHVVCDVGGFVMGGVAGVGGGVYEA